ncbi:hypothetical protein [Paludibacterium purpuratum]|uniref:Hemolysin type calcium-binding protein n=1 Tax=Paludibacterium purpuratum TaxID=1144873 RepID=A0A4R7BFH6_9NEIS|nr:hypothetical protein [Paludibacterium purpuratum]TDR82805.1 hypothetical protein DFP86_101195 [Paludibacterium purpuratum]
MKTPYSHDSTDTSTSIQASRTKRAACAATDGNDILAGGPGNDTYLYGHCGGHDTIIDLNGEGDYDKLVLIGIRSDEVTVKRQNNDVILVIRAKQGGDDGTITILGMLDGETAGVESIRFTDTRWSSRTEILQHLPTSADTPDNQWSRSKRSLIEETASNDDAFFADNVTWGASQYEALNRMLTSAETM